MKINNLYLLFCLVILNSMIYLLAFIMMDSARDIFYAKNIIDGLNYPLIGPDIGGFAHVGPVWFYFLALPALTGSLIFMALWVGFFASLKIILIYILGKKLLEVKFGLFWVGTLLLPGWQSITSFFIIHTNLIQSLSILYLLLLFCFYESNNPKYFKWIMFSLALSIHAHPSTLILGIFLPYIIFKKWNILNAKTLVVSSLFFIVLFLPYLFDQISNSFPDFERMATIVQTHNNLTIFQRLPNFILSLIYSGPIQIYNFIVVWSPIAGYFMLVTYVITLLSSIVGLIVYSLKGKKYFFHIIKLVSLFLVFCLMILAMRSFIPFYMMLVLSPIFSGILAFGLYNLFKNINILSLQIGVLIFFVINLLPSLSLHKQYSNNQFSIPNARYIEKPVSFTKPDTSKSLDGISILYARSLTSVLCDDVFVHGPFSIVLDYTSAIPVDFFCSNQNIKLGGIQKTNQNHIFIMHKSFWNKISIKPTDWIYKGLAYSYDFINHSKSKHWQLAKFDDYIHPQRKGIKKQPEKIIEYIFTSKADSVIIITNILPFYIGMKIKSIEIEDSQNKPDLLLKNLGNWMYQCNKCNQPDKITWRIKILSEDKNSIDINELIYR